MYGVFQMITAGEMVLFGRSSDVVLTSIPTYMRLVLKH